MSTSFIVIVALLSIFAGSTASVVGFGIGSILTPIIATRYGTDLAVAVVVIPHLAGSSLRGWRLRGTVDWRMFRQFGILSAIGGLVGALAFARLAPAVLTRILGVLLIITASAGLTRWPDRWKPSAGVARALGILSGFFGGVVGNQGGLRAAALTSFELSPSAFVATSTVIGIVVDVVRAPIYVARAGGGLATLWSIVAIATAGVLAGTLLGERLLLGLSPQRFRQIVAAAIGVLGAWFLASG